MSDKLSSKERCTECGMAVSVTEYHPYAACLMYRACQDAEVVRVNLLSVQASGAQAECDLRASSETNESLSTQCASCGLNRGACMC